MSRRSLLNISQVCTRALQQSQACGQLQLVPDSCASHLHTAAQQQAARLAQAAAQPVTTARTTSSSWQLQQRSTACLQHPQHWPAAAAARFSTTPLQAESEEDLRVVQAEIPENEYHRLADETLDFLQERLEVFVEDLDIDGGDVEHAQGVLTVRLGSHGTYVINKQTPNRQIWLSSPLTGPFRYDYHAGSWVYHRDGRELLSQLQEELTQLLGSTPHLLD